MSPFSLNNFVQVCLLTCGHVGCDKFTLFALLLATTWVLVFAE